LTFDKLIYYISFTMITNKKITTTTTFSITASESSGWAGEGGGCGCPCGEVCLHAVTNC